MALRESAKAVVAVAACLGLFALLSPAALPSEPSVAAVCSPVPPCPGTLTVNYPGNLGLGNLLFYYASLLGIAAANGKPPVFPVNVPFAPFDVFDLGPVTVRNFVLGKGTEIVKEEASGTFLPKAFTLPCQVSV